ncbi:MAG: hypothetical protein J0I48_12910 [Devosia sp.]|uniref:hypothetical protein n=1 Tax=Devosia sp. 66-22 TaxID=1895753 RepID=UPI00092AA4A7|nr:hypothetical protein [Devosia sp. 66-22]MBN9347080.1 hypothetical protein [Devosia sp.]OJX50295.1 MAG: hypothetical protein BGO81_04225 [Devosia sp. 66-22]
MFDPTDPMDDQEIAAKAQKVSDISHYETELMAFNLRWILNVVHGVSDRAEFPMMDMVERWTVATIKRMHAVMWVMGKTPPTVRYEDDPLRFLEENSGLLETALDFAYSASSARLLKILGDHAALLEDGTPLPVTTPLGLRDIFASVGAGLAERGFVVPDMPDLDADRLAAIAAWQEYIGKVRNDIDTLAQHEGAAQ